VRVTSGSTYASMSAALGASLGRVQSLQSQLGSGRRINAMSDDPVGAATALRYRALETDQTAYSASAANANTWLGAADTSLQSMSGALAKVRELAINATNGSLSPDARKALSAQITSLRQEVADLANTPQEGQALFGGFSATAVTRAADGTWSFSGDDGGVQRRVAAGVTVQVNVSGRTAFGFDQPAGKDLLSVIDAISAHALAGDGAGLATDQADLAARTQSVLGALGTVGATQNRVDAAQARSQQYSDQITAERSQIEDIDIAQAILQLNSAQTGYQAALGAVGKGNLPSLANFLS
jgi:flagellar hook-associated protein 3 FlgL